MAFCLIWKVKVITTERRSLTPKNQIRRWFFEGIRPSSKRNEHHQYPWWKVMCLTGVDYFSTLGYQPGIALLAAGLLSPIATALVVLITLFGLVPLYSRVASESPHGQGSVAMLERLLPSWSGKTLVLILLGFAATDFVITITLSAADATAHLLQNPLWPSFLSDRVGLTMVILGVLGAIFLAGFREAIGLAVIIVLSYLVCNTVVIGRALMELYAHPELLANWHAGLTASFGNVWTMVGVSAILFPKLALGMSGFETGVAVMPLVKGHDDDNHERPLGRIENTKRLLLVAAIVMAVLLLTSTVVTTVLVPPEAYKAGGIADGRAVAYLAHLYLGETMGTIYDISTILILWFAGASAMTGLLNLVPRYLPRYGMAPEWTRAQRPLVVFFTAITFLVTIIFKASVDAQAGAYATGVLVLFVSAALGVVLASWSEGLKRRLLYGFILIVFIYTAIANMIERPEGLHIASCFIGAIIVFSLASRVLRSLELRVDEVKFDSVAEGFFSDSLSTGGGVNLLAHRPGGMDYADKERETRNVHKLTADEAAFVFLEVSVSDPSQFTETLIVTGHVIDGRRVLRCHSHAVPNAIAAILLYLRDKTKTIPQVYFGWTEGNPIAYVVKYIFLGEGETAPVAREILRQVERNPARRPRIIVG